MNRFVALVGLLAVTAAFAIEPPKDTPATQEVPDAQAPAKPDDAGAKPDEDAPQADEEELPPLPADTVPAGPPPQRFNPTEKVRADFPVSFPIDI
jgi:hypothetical protein